MIYISHRGNLKTKIAEEENRPEKILYCISLGYSVEIDVWWENGIFMLGHDKPQYSINIDFLKNPYLWCHAKNLNSLHKMLELGTHCFWHQTDDYTITSKGIIWAYPGKNLSNLSVAVLQKQNQYPVELLKNCYGICSDDIEKVKLQLGD